jgi:sterol desaturase/sphingolipid hydroxylase (fatty acid hydroxylase superfamily)
MFEQLEQRFEELSAVLGVLEYIALFFFFLIVLETAWDIYTKRRTKYKETIANFLIAIVSAILERTLYGAVFVICLTLTESLIPYKIPLVWWSWALALLAADFTYYWMHRFEHEIRILWANHIVHHSSPEYNLTTSLRLAWVDSLIEWIFLVPMIVIGFDVVQTIIAFLFVVVYQTWVHTEKIGKLSLLDNFLNTPSVHRVHHGSNRKYLDKNYGGILMIWDHLFGTFQAEEEKVRYGITESLNSSNPLAINFKEYWLIVKDVRSSNNLKEAIGYVFGRPGWKPEKAGADKEKSLEKVVKN